VGNFEQHFNFTTDLKIYANDFFTIFFMPEAIPKKLLVVTNLKTEICYDNYDFFKTMSSVRNYPPGLGS
jgi:hypothetical protein